MDNKITGAELLIAIGDLPEELLSKPSKRKSTPLMLLKPLSAAACIIIGISVMFGAFSQRLPKFDFDASGGDSMNAVPPNQENSNGADLTEAYFVDSPFGYLDTRIIISESGEISNKQIFDNKRLLLGKNENKEIKILFTSAPNESNAMIATFTKTDEHGNEMSESVIGKEIRGTLTYSIVADGACRIEFKNTNFSKKLSITIEYFEEYYLLTANYTE